MRIAGKINYPIQQQKPLKENTAAYCFIGEIDLPKTSDGIQVVGQIGDSVNLIIETPSLGVIWNWKTNLNRGKSIYDDKRIDAYNFIQNHPNTYTEEMLLKCAFQKYNMYGYEKVT
ncbi:MAG: hypothetical protein HND40_11150 [Ignavibacteriota bacterium]|nr:hypothetical protein [Ignavibacteriota bacterium]MCO6447857.1 hypothetical protein [Ignavibacterium album]QKK00087.1 MAG: hypothetical protein HND40_11150 [Ignavibacteriota bacterium]